MTWDRPGGPRIAFLGTGARGASIGADFALAGLDITFIKQWPAHVEAIRERGITVNLPSGTINARVPALHLCDCLHPGDVVLIRTGHGSRFFSEAATWYDGEPGLGLAAAERLSALEPGAVGADNFAIDVVPPVDQEIVLPCHQHLIMRHGIYLHEGMKLDGLAQSGRYEFAYAFALLRIEGATGRGGQASTWASIRNAVGVGRRSSQFTHS